MLLNEGVDPVSNTPILSKKTFKAITTASALVLGSSSDENVSIVGYGLGWDRYSYKGYEVYYRIVITIVSYLTSVQVITHDGALPGFLSRVLFLPHHKAAMVSFTNTDNGTAANAPVVYKAIDSLFGLDELVISTKLSTLESSLIYLLNSVEGSSSTKPSSSHSITPQETADPSLPLESYAGTYAAADYGEITFCTLTPPGKDGPKRTAESTYCDNVREKFAIVYEAEGQNFTNSKQLIAASSRVWTEQMKMTHLTQDTFSLSILTLFTEGYGADKTPFAYYFGESVLRTARFIVHPPHAYEDQLSSSAGKVMGFYVCGIIRDVDAVQGDCITGEGSAPGSLVWFFKLDTESI